MIVSTTLSPSAQRRTGLAGMRAREPVFPPGLLMDMQTMLERLWRELGRGPTLDAYLLAAGIAQIADDHLHAPSYLLGRAAPYLAARGAPVARVAGTAAGLIDSVARASRSRRQTTRAVLSWRSAHQQLVHRLAAAQITELLDAVTAHDGASQVPVRARSRRQRPAVGAGAIDIAGARVAMQQALGSLPVTLRASVVKLPSCFCHFDQRPADIVTLTRRFSEGWPDRHRRLLVVGVRTSGSYLAPLCAATLEALGYSHVRTLTVRPGRGLLAGERSLVHATARAHGLALVLDDPPVSGRTIRDSAAMLEHAGLPAGAIALVLATFGAPELPRVLHGFHAVLLGAAEWSVEADLKPAAVRRALIAISDPERAVVEVEPLATGSVTPEQLSHARGHRRALFRVLTRDASGGSTCESVLVEGVGIGYLGAHRLAAPSLMQRSSPRVFALRDGLLFREWLPEDRRLRAPIADEEAVAGVLARYVAERQTALACPRDLTIQLTDETPAWLVASSILSAAFGRVWPLARAFATDRAVRRVLEVARPSLVDGNTDLAQWFWRTGPGAALIKPDIGEDSFSNLTGVCFDAAFDLAGITARSNSWELPEELRRAFFELTGETVSAERWLLYELVHLWGRGRTEPEQLQSLTRAAARAAQRYFASTYMSDIGVSATARHGGAGALCALDVDGVLETQQLGFSTLTPTAALALRALRCHGYRPVLATGRSLGEAIERCQAYGLAGAAAEYGSVIFSTHDGQTRPLLDEERRAVLARLRSGLTELDGVELDPDYEHAVRAFTTKAGHRLPLTAAQVAFAVASIGDTAIQVIAGERQTDFVASGVSKGAGLRALAATLGEAAAQPYAFAVGDTVADQSLLHVAGRAFAPRHADLALARSGFELMTRPYQAGLTEAVAHMIGHAPGRCARCREHAVTRERATVRTMLSVPEQGRLRMAMSLMELWWRARS